MSDPIQLTPDEIASAQPLPEPQSAAGPVQLSPSEAANARQQSGQIDPLQDFSPEQLVDLQRQDPNFNLVNEYSQRTDLQEQPGMNQKIADAYHLARQTGNVFEKYIGNTPLETAGKVGAAVIKTGWETAKGFGRQAWNYAQ
jgi:hypothetical protein